MRAAPLLLVTLLAAACSRPDNAAGAGGVSAGEARALDDAAEMLQSQQLPAAAIPPTQMTPRPQQTPDNTQTKTPAKPAG